MKTGTVVTSADRKPDPKTVMRQKLISAAVDCFEKYGVQRTRVEDAAQAVGISATNFYNFFPSRAALIDAVTLRRAESIARRVGPTIHEAPTLASAVVDGVVQTVTACRDDEVFMQLFRLTRRDRLGQLGMNSAAFGHESLVRAWLPAFEQARERGEVRDHLGEDDETIAWLGTVLVMFLLNDRIAPPEIRKIVSQYVAPAIAEH
jgi:AcrR family transcriptional regulator